MQLLVVLAQLISTPRSAPHLPTSAFFLLARPSLIHLDRIFCLPVVNLNLTQANGQSAAADAPLDASHLEALQRPINCSIDPPFLSCRLFVIFHQYDDPEPSVLRIVIVIGKRLNQRRAHKPPPGYYLRPSFRREGRRSKTAILAQQAHHLESHPPSSLSALGARWTSTSSSLIDAIASRSLSLTPLPLRLYSYISI